MIFNKDIKKVIKAEQEKSYRAGCDYTFEKTTSEWRQKLTDLELEHEEKLEEKDYEISRLEIELRNRKNDDKKVQEAIVKVKERESQIRKEDRRIANFKELAEKEVKKLMNQDTEKYQNFLRLLLGSAKQLEEK